MISGDEDFQQPYLDGKEGVERNLNSLRQLTADNSEQQQRLAKVEEVYQQWLTEAIDPPIDIRTQYGPGAMGLDQAAYIVKQGRGKQGMDQLRELMDAFIAERTKLVVGANRGCRHRCDAGLQHRDYWWSNCGVGGSYGRIPVSSSVGRPD